MIAKLWQGLALAIIVLLAFLWLRNGCNKPNPADISQKIEAAAKAAWDSARGIDTPIIHQLTIRGDSIQKNYDTLKQKYVIDKQNLAHRGADLKQTLAALNAARGARDTASQLNQGDTLQAEVISGLPAVEGFTHLTDSMINAQETLLAVKDSIIYRQDQLGKIAQTTITAQQLQYDIIHKDDVHKTAQLRFYKPVAIGGTAIIAMVIVLKLLIK